MKLHSIRLLICALMALGFATAAHSQDALPLNAAASVNGMIISNDTVEQGIQAALAQGQKVAFRFAAGAVQVLED